MARAIAGSEWCYNHDPAHAAERSRNGRLGGTKAGRGRPNEEVAAIKRRLIKLADDVERGHLMTNVGAVTNQILGTVVRLIDVEVRVREQMEVIARIEKLEEQEGDRGA